MSTVDDALHTAEAALESALIAVHDAEAPDPGAAPSEPVKTVEVAASSAIPLGPTDTSFRGK